MPHITEKQDRQLTAIVQAARKLTTKTDRCVACNATPDACQCFLAPLRRAVRRLDGGGPFARSGA